MIRVPPSSLTLALLGALVATGCSNPAPADVAAPTAPAPDATAPAHPDIFRFRIGDLEAAALKDGDIDLPNDNSVFGVGRPVADVSAMLADAGLPTNALRLSIQPLLVRGDGRLWLFDTGAAAASPFGSSSTRVVLRAAALTGWSRKRSRAAGAGAAMSTRKPSTTSAFVTVCWVPSDSRVRR